MREKNYLTCGLLVLCLFLAPILFFNFSPKTVFFDENSNIGRIIAYVLLFVLLVLVETLFIIFTKNRKPCIFHQKRTFSRNLFTLIVTYGLLILLSYAINHAFHQW